MLLKLKLVVALILVAASAFADECRWVEEVRVLPPKTYHPSPTAGNTQQGLREAAYCETLPKDQLNWRAYQACLSDAYVRDAQRREQSQGQPIIETIRTHRCVPTTLSSKTADTKKLDSLTE